MYTNEWNVIINVAGGLGLILGGFIFSKRSKASEQVKRNVSLGGYALGAVAFIFHLPNLWRVITDSYEPTPINLPEMNTQHISELPNLATTSTQMVELFGATINLSHLISIAAGLAVVIVGLMYKEKNWGKYATLLGVVAILAGAIQMII